MTEIPDGNLRVLKLLSRAPLPEAYRKAVVWALAEISALRKDKERLDWADENWGIGIAAAQGNTCREAIDAALGVER